MVFFVFGGLLFQQHNWAWDPARTIRRANNQAGFVSTLLGIGALSYWVAKKALKHLIIHIL
jgi:hypothetical protein